MNDRPDPWLEKRIAVKKARRDTANWRTPYGYHEEPTEGIANLIAAIGYRTREERDMSFLDRGNCVGLPSWIFYPRANNGHIERTGATNDSRRAKAVCADCPVSAACLEYAVDSEPFGIWGGTSERERRELRKTRDEAA